MRTYQIAFTVQGALSGQFSAAMKQAQAQMTALGNSATLATARASKNFRQLESYANNLNTIQGQISSYRQLENAIGSTSVQTAQAKQKTQNLLTEYQAQKKQLEAMRVAYDRFKQVRRENKSSMSAEQYRLMGEQLKAMRQELKSQEQAVRSAQSAYAQANRASQSMTNSLRGQQSQLSSLSSSLAQANVNVNQLTQHEAALQREIAQANSALERQAQVASAQNAHQTASSNLTNAFGNFQGAVSTAQTLVNPFVGAVQTAMTFEKSMSKVKALTGATGAEFERLQAQAKELGATTQFTATQSADAMGYLGQRKSTLRIMKWYVLGVKCFEILKAQKLQRGLKRRA